MFVGVFDHSILKIAQEKKLVRIDFVNIRDFGVGKHNTVDDTPYGGGAGMVMRVDVIASALANLKLKTKNLKLKERIVLLDPQGKTFNQKKAKTLSKIDHLIFICGRYEGVDERVRDLVDEEISIGDYVLTGGEIPTMAIIDSVARLIPGVITKESTENESFSTQLLEYPQYTRPPVFNNKPVPPILLSGDHKKIIEWRKIQSIHKTNKRRPDLLKRRK